MHLSHRKYLSFVKTWGVSTSLTVALIWGFVVAVSAQELGSAPQSGVNPQKLERLYQIRSQQIPLLEDFIRKYPQSPRRPDTLFRLGEAYFETAKYHEIQNDRAGSEARQLKAIQVLEQLKADHSGFQRLDEALFVLANAYMERKNVAQAGAVLSDLADRYPDSPVIQQASLLLGDHYFAEKQFPRAEAYYLKAADDEKIRAYIHYKLGWVAVNQDQPAKALKYFEMVLAERNLGSDYSRDAAREMIWPAIQVYGSSKVVEYLEGKLQDPALIESSLSSLAQNLQKKGEHQTAAKILEQLRTKFPTSEEASDWMSAQIKSEEALGHTQKVRDLVIEAAQGTDSADPQALAKLLASAKKFHAEAQKTKDIQLKSQNYEMAIVYYQAFVSKSSPTDPKAIEVQFYLGEALYARDRFSEAAQAYEVAAKSPSSIQTQASWNWLLTAEKLAEGFKYKGTTPQAPTAADEKYLEVARFIQNVSGITLAQKRRASYLAARLLYQINDYERALPALEALAKQHSDSQEGKLAAQLVLDVYNLKQDYRKVAELARDYKSNASDSSSRSELTGLEQKAALKVIQEEEKIVKSQQGEGRIAALEVVGKKYLDYAKTYPTAPLVDGAVWAAYQSLTEVAAERKTLPMSEMKEAFQLLTTQYSNSKYSSQAILLMGRYMSGHRATDEELRAYRKHRDAWASLYREESRDERGRLGMLLWRMSNDNQRKDLEADFLKLPVTDQNREAVAYGKLSKVRELHSKFEKLKLSTLKTLQKNTATKVNLLDQLQSDVTDLAQFKVGETTVAGLHILADAYLQMASDLRTAPIPSQLQGENLSRYQSAVSEKAGQFESKGREAEKLARDTAKDLNLSDS